jgi:hypothetical protein
MTEAQKLIIKYFHIVCRLSDLDSPITYDKMLQWASESTFYKSMFQTAIQCAISETEAILSELHYRELKSFFHFNILTELKQMQ